MHLPFQLLKRSWIVMALILCLASTVSGQADEEALVTEYENSIGMAFRLIQTASFTMGSSVGNPDERPQHEVQLSSYYIGIHEVTQEQYQEVMGENPSEYGEPQHPVIRVNWYDAVAFCEQLSEREGLTYRLPTEAEWEYAATVGQSNLLYAWGNSDLPVVDGVAMANVSDERCLATYPTLDGMLGLPFSGYDDGFADLAYVGSFPANGFGLYDMDGNVMEWCQDVYSIPYYRTSPVENPTGPDSGPDRVMRGGSWLAGRKYSRVTGRFRDAPDFVASTVGFRCVLEVSAPAIKDTG